MHHGNVILIAELKLIPSPTAALETVNSEDTQQHGWEKQVFKAFQFAFAWNDGPHL